MAAFGTKPSMAHSVRAFLVIEHGMDCSDILSSYGPHQSSNGFIVPLRADERSISIPSHSKPIRLHVSMGECYEA